MNFAYALELSEDMYKDGYQTVTNIDVSPTVIKQMQEHYKESIPSMKCTFAPLAVVISFDH